MNNQTIYKPTVIQKLLGRNYKWWYILLFYYRSNNSSRLNSLGYLVSALLNSAILIAIWSTSKQIGFSDIFTYIIVGNLFFIDLHFSNDLLQDISNGKIITFMLFPSNLLGIYLIKDLGWNSFIQIVNIIINIVIIFSFHDLIIFQSWNTAFLFLLYLPIVYLLTFLFEVLLGSLAFYLPWGWGVLSLGSDLNRSMRGANFPLSLFSFTLPLTFLFPAFTFYHPMQIYLGKYSPLETFYVFAAGVAWCIILYFLAKWVFKMGLKKNEAVGL